VITSGGSDGSSATRACSTSSWINSTACSGVTRAVTCAERNAPVAPCSAQPRCTSSSIAVSDFRIASEAGGFYLTSNRALQAGTHLDDTRSVELERATGRALWFKYGSGGWQQAF